MIARILSAAIGLWLMVSPSVLDYDGATRVNDWIVGPIVVSLSVIAASDVTRGVRWGVLPLGAWLVLASWFLGGGSTATLNALIAGLLLIGLSFVGGSISRRYGGGWSALWSANRPGHG
jgi:hypothetical protein